MDMSAGEKLCLDINEEYIERCGEIFRTNSDRIIIHCTMCEDKFGSFQEFCEHITNEHNRVFAPSSKNVDVDASREQTKESEINEKVTAQHEEELSIQDDIVDIFDLCLSDNDLNIKNFEEILNDIEIFFKTSTEQEATSSSSLSTSESIAEIREVRRCNIQDASVEKRPHKCFICGLGFKDKNNMLHHVKRHSMERNHECSECNKKFYTGYELRIHSKVHMQKRPFSCDECEKTFRTNTLLKSHKKRHINQRDYKCSDCGKEFFEKRNLQEHMLIHKNVRDKFVCNSCEAEFALRKSLLRHQRTHEKKKIFKCDVCDAVFVQSRGLSTHMKKKHNEL